jgi:tetratricopeptide (TPR) repeat protein
MHGWAWFILLVVLGQGLIKPLVPARAARPPAKQDSSAATPAETVEELVLQCTRALAAGDWESAATHSSALLHNYGDRQELIQVCQRFQLVLLDCRLRLHQWEEAVPLFEPALRSLRAAPGELHGELLFQKATCEAHLKQYAAARKSISAALPLLPESGVRKHDAMLLLAVCTLHCNQPEEAGKLVEQLLPSLPISMSEGAVMLGMRAFLEAKKPEAAFALFSRGRAASKKTSTRIGVQLLLLEAASASLENGEPANALCVASKIEPPERLISIQMQRIARIKGSVGAAQSPHSTQRETKTMLLNEAARMQSEIDSVGNGASLAEATRLLVASAYRALNRPYEAALVLDDATSLLRPSEVLESASVELVKTWFELERWQRVVDSANRFSKAYPASRLLPMVHYLKGCAEQKSGSLENALETFQTISKDTKAGEFAISAGFMHALTLFLDNRLPEAVQGLKLFLQRHKKHSFAEAAAHWLCVAKARTGPPQEVQTAANAYLDLFPNGENKPAVLLRRAQSFVSLNQRSAATVDLEALLAEAPEHACSGEAGLLLGDCRLALENGEGALAAWRGIPASQPAANEEGLLKCARLLYRCGRFAELLELMRTLEPPITDSPRIAEAAAWLCKACDRGDHPEDAVTWTLKQLEAVGNDPSSPGAEPLLMFATIRAGSQPVGNGWASGLAALSAAAASDSRHTLDSRLQWAQAFNLHVANQVDTTEELIRAATLYPANITSPAVLADGADAAERRGLPVEAERLWRELLKWHPGAQQRDRAFIALAKMDSAANRTVAAWDWIRRFERATPTSPLRPRLLLVKAALQNHAGSAAEALGTLEQMIREKGGTAALKAEALFHMGTIHRATGATRVAIAYLQRAYVSYGRFEPWATKSYIMSAEAFQDLGDHASARNTYREFLASAAPADSPERALAVKRLKVLEGTP